VERLHANHAIEQHVQVADRARAGQLASRASVVFELLRWLSTDHRRLRAIHANGDGELGLLLPLLPALRVPVVVWYHSRALSPRTARLAPLWRLGRKRITWAPVSHSALAELQAARITDGVNAVVRANPIDPAEVVASTQPDRPRDPVIVGYLGFEHEVKGILLLPAIAEKLVGEPVRLECVTKDWPRERNTVDVNDALDRLRELPNVRFRSRDWDVRRIFAEIDVLLVPSLSESFCRIAAEAMMNGIPVVASDLPAVREVCGDAARYFPVGDVERAAREIIDLIHDRALFITMADRGRVRAQAFLPDVIAEEFRTLYR
jgi:glycosyltransferase involved in cell wall biosynthesis